MISRRLVPLAATALIVALGVSGCASNSEYCKTAKAHESILQDFGSTRTDKAYGGYLKTAKALAKVAPKEISPQWEAVRDSLHDVIETQGATNPKLAIEDMNDYSKVNGLSSKQMKALNAAYTAFNNTAKDRKKIVADFVERCDLDLSPTAGKD